MPTGRLTHLVTDATASAEALGAFRELGVAVTIAGRGWGEVNESRAARPVCGPFYL